MNKKKENIISRVYHIAAQGKATLVFSCIASVVGMLSAVVPYMSVYFIVKHLLIPSNDDNSAMMFWAMIAGAGILGNMVFGFLGSFGCHQVAFKLLYNFRIRVMEHLGHLSVGFFSDNTTGAIQKTMDENIEKIEGFIAHMLPDIIGSAAVLIVLFAALFFLNGWLALAVLVSVIVGFIFQMLVFGGEKAKQLWADVSIASKNMTGAFSEYVKGMAEVKLFGLTGTITRGLEDNINQFLNWELRQYKRSGIPMSAYKTIILSTLAIVLPVGIILIALNPTADILLAVLMALIITPAIYDPLMTCVNYGTQMGQLAVGLDSIDEILNKKPIVVSKNPEEPKGWDVCFDKVSFSYQKQDDPMRTMALESVSFAAPQGEMTALVGPSGSGKSTVTQLLSRFWDVENGSIRIGDVDIRSIDGALLMDSIAMVLQDTYIFADTIWGNITMNREYSKEQVEKAAKAAQCHEFITRLNDGYNTRVGTGGANLSGGETQRISIARAILKGSPIVVLDEALAYSDAENENLIQSAIANLVKDKTVIIIAHRLQSIRRADNILVIQNGKITERGTHDELMNTNTEYRTLWELQHQADEWSIKTGEVIA